MNPNQRNNARDQRALRFALPCLLIVLTLAVSFAGAAERRNFILMIGDGMGFDAVAHAHFHRFGMHPADEDHRLAFEKWTSTGYLYTQAGSSLVTDSAAAASALYTGKKHRRGAICVDDRNVPIPSLFELAHQAGYAVGVVTTVPITDATPAATFAHVPHREEFQDIYRQLLASRYEVFLGAGANGDTQYLPKDFEKLAREAGYNLARSAGELKRAEKLPLLGVFGDVTLPYEFDRLSKPSDAPRLTDLVEKALQRTVSFSSSKAAPSTGRPTPGTSSGKSTRCWASRPRSRWWRSGWRRTARGTRPSWWSPRTTKPVN